MFDAGYRPPLPAPVRVTGRYGMATIGAQLINMRDGGFISAHDYKIGSLIAEVVCGGDIEPDSLVSEQWLLDLEHKYFLELLNSPKTQERVTHVGIYLGNGKVLHTYSPESGGVRIDSFEGTAWEYRFLMGGPTF